MSYFEEEEYIIQTPEEKDLEYQLSRSNPYDEFIEWLNDVKYCEAEERKSFEVIIMNDDEFLEAMDKLCEIYGGKGV